MKKEKKDFSTRDIYLAATLVTLKYELVGVDYQIEGEKRHPVGYFRYEATEDLMDTTRKYWQGGTLVDPRAFTTNLWSLKSMVMNEYKNPNNDINQKYKGETIDSTINKMVEENDKQQ